MKFEGCKHHCSDILNCSMLYLVSFNILLRSGKGPYRAQLQLSTCELHVAGLFRKSRSYYRLFITKPRTRNRLNL